MLGQVAALKLERERTLTNMGDVALFQLVAKTLLVGAAQQAEAKRAINLRCAGENLHGDGIELIAAFDRGALSRWGETREHHALDAILQYRHIEVDEEAERMSTEAQVSEQLRLVNW